MAGSSGAETSAAQLQAAARAGSGLTKGEPYIKPYDYFSFGSDAREVSGNYSPARVPSGTGPPEGEASGPPANAETCFISTV